MNEISEELLNGLSMIAVGEGKRPIGSWKESQTRALTEAELMIKSTHKDFRYYGIVTGYDGLEVIDVDLKVIKNEKKRAAFWKSLLQILQDHIEGFENKFVIYQTANHGYHILYKAGNIEGNKKLAAFKGEKEAVIETRGIGGYVVRYDKKVSEKGYAQIGKISDEDRNMLIEMCRYYNNYDPNELVKGVDIKSWDDYNSQHSVWDLVQDEFKMVGEDSKAWRILRHGEPKSDHSGYIYKDTGLMYLFSSSTQYEAEKPYSAYAVYTKKVHGGDYSASSKELYRLGYGSRNIVKREYNDPVKNIDEKDLVFPIDIFPNPFRDYIMENYTTSNLNIDFMGASLLWVMSVIIGNSMRVKVKNLWYDSACVWIACVADRGVGKTPSSRVIISPLVALNNKELANHKKAMDEYNKIKEATKKGESVSLVEPKRGQFIVGDITIEALADLHQENPKSIGMNKDELAGWIKDMNKYRSGSDLEFWLSSFNSEFSAINRKVSSNAFIKKPFIAVLGGVQPAVFDDIASTGQFEDNGFFDRLLVCNPKTTISKWTDEEVSQDSIDWYDAAIRNMYTYFNDLYARDPEGYTMTATFTKEGKKEQTRIFDEIVEIQNHPDTNTYVKAMLAKQHGNIFRMSLIINTMWAFGCTTGEIKMDEIGADSVLRAERLVKYFIAMAKKVKYNRMETKNIRDVADKTKGTPRLKFKAMYDYDKELNRTQVADMLGVSVRTIRNWINEEEKNLKT